MLHSSVDLVTTAAAPVAVPSAIVTPGKIIELVPRIECRPICTGFLLSFLYSLGTVGLVSVLPL